MSVQIGGLGRWGVVLGLSAVLVGASVLTAADDPGRVILVAQKIQKKKAVAKKGEEDMAPAAKAAAPAAAPADGSLSFKRDIAPILVANCIGCHTGTGRGITLGKLDMSSFDKLMAGGKRGKDIVGGDADGSTLVRMIKGEETPKMPPNNGQRGFAEEAADKIAAWVQQGAKLDAGIASTDPITKYAASLDDLRKAELAKLSPEERDKLAEQAGLERWKKGSKTTPEIASTKGGHFLLLSTLPKDRVNRLLQTMETQYTQINKLFSTPKGPALSPNEKIGLYVFKDNVSFVEFVRTVENQEVEAGEQARAKLTVESPYIVAVDPAGGNEEAPITPAKKGVRKKKTEESPTGPERTLAAVLTEQLVTATANRAGKPPRWVSLGLAAFLASHVDSPSSPYYRRLRVETAENIRIGWQPKANEALGAEGKLETTRAVGFALFEWMSANAPAAALASFVRTMLEGQAKLDDAIGSCLYLNRQEFLDGSELWLSEHYGRR
jgi:mono/diheme cytochrome c family protein